MITIEVLHTIQTPQFEPKLGKQVQHGESFPPPPFFWRVIILFWSFLDELCPWLELRCMYVRFFNLALIICRWVVSVVTTEVVVWRVIICFDRLLMCVTMVTIEVFVWCVSTFF